MKKYFRYELKNNILPILIFSIFATLYSVMSLFTFRYGSGAYGFIQNVMAVLPILCFTAPILCFKFKMNKRSVDEFYSLPISREKLYLVKSLVGLCMVCIPFTVSFFITAITVAARSGASDALMGIPLYFLMIPCAVLIFGINSFAFTRANKIIDGMIFISFFSTAFMLLILFIARTFSLPSDVYLGISYWTPSGPLNFVLMEFGLAASGEGLTMPHFSELIGLIVMVLVGVACWFGLFYIQRFEKAENAEQISTSWFGYKVFIPFCLCTIISVMPLMPEFIILYVMLIMGMVALNIYYRRSFRLPLRDLLALLIAICVGFGIGIITSFRT